MKKEKKRQNVKRIDECVKRNGPQEASKEEVKGINIDSRGTAYKEHLSFSSNGG